MLGSIVFWLGLTVALIIGFVYFRDLGDVSQMLIRVKRKDMIRFIRNEYRLLATGLGALLLMAVHRDRHSRKCQQEQSVCPFEARFEAASTG